MKQHLSKVRKEMYAAGWEATCGRCKKYDYDSHVAGKIKVDGRINLKFGKRTKLEKCESG